MQDLKDFLKKFDLLYYLTGLTIILAFLAVVHTILYREVPEANKELFIHLIGIVEGSFVGGLVGFFFARSKKDTP
jgi:Na+/citrate or Na+/malate symporter